MCRCASIPQTGAIADPNHSGAHQNATRISLVDFLNLGASTTSSRWSIILHSSASHVSTSALAFKLLHLVFELIDLSKLVVVQPLDRLLDSIFNLLLVICRELGCNLLVLDGVPHVVGVVLQGVLGLNLLLVLLILRLVLLRILDHLLNVLLAQPSLVISDGDLVLLASGLVFRGDIQNTIGINIKANSDLRDTPRSRGDPRELKLPKEVVVPRPGPLTLINLDQHTRLVVRICGEDLLLLGWNGGVPWNKH
ncbi:hypothetical protein EJB05_03813, partial [Eragrostis curvula]